MIRELRERVIVTRNGRQRGTIIARTFGSNKPLYDVRLSCGQVVYYVDETEIDDIFKGCVAGSGGFAMPILA